MKIPILKLNDILLTSIQVDLTDQEAIEFQSDVMHAVMNSRARGIVIDITSMDVVDSYMARVLTDTATMVRLLGTKTVLTGMQPTVAMTLVEMGRELIGVKTALNLEKGFEELQELLAREQAENDG